MPIGKQKQSEQDLHIAVAEYLAVALTSPFVWWTSIDHAGGGPTVGRYRKARGVKAGIPDILIVYCGTAVFIELKAEGGKLTAEQIDCHDDLRGAVARIAVCRSLQDVINTLAEWRVPTNARLAA